jgi:hypothetical protein
VTVVIHLTGAKKQVICNCIKDAMKNIRLEPDKFHWQKQDTFLSGTNLNLLVALLKFESHEQTYIFELYIAS